MYRLECLPLLRPTTGRVWSYDTQGRMTLRRQMTPVGKGAMTSDVRWSPLTIAIPTQGLSDWRQVLAARKLHSQRLHSCYSSSARSSVPSPRIAS